MILVTVGIACAVFAFVFLANAAGQTNLNSANAFLGKGIGWIVWALVFGFGGVVAWKKS